MLKIVIGSLWKEKDPRFDPPRIVKILDYDEGEVTISNERGTRITRVNASSFPRRFAVYAPATERS